MEAYTEELLETYEYFEEDERILYKDSTYDIVSKVLVLGEGSNDGILSGYLSADSSGSV